ncbi:hypothetical protein M427DRAFT_494001 [Gonapodya prolifera JEL478]|uniref:Ankyrin n=1 Tax=Gonapodya prolifera (strain JEL478) TaxID=1344416 RepID=A0A139AYC0_GONPJ|nr:hypothetical protein M427DRAFT_494001 [Gonapodya prolifera JEL478]|eukprot:KXS21710.1 hypothetical protein M427DRAFT_494001 [Gonapodya prolifera JEL478]
MHIAADAGHFGAFAALLDHINRRRGRAGDCCETGIKCHRETSPREFHILKRRQSTRFYGWFKKRFYEVACTLVSHVDVTEDLLNTPLISGAQNGHLGIVKLTIEKGVDIHIGEGTALLGAITGGYEELSSYLFSTGEWDATVYPNKLLLHLAKIVQVALDQNHSESTHWGDLGEVLQAASVGRYDPIAKILLNKLRVSQEDKSSVLELVCVKDYPKVIEQLLIQGHANRPIRQCAPSSSCQVVATTWSRLKCDGG